MNQIIYQYIRVVSEQQRALHTIVRDISGINRRLTDVINLYSNGDSLRTIVPTNENIRNLVSSPPETTASNLEEQSASSNTDEGNEDDDEGGINPIEHESPCY